MAERQTPSGLHRIKGEVLTEESCRILNKAIGEVHPSRGTLFSQAMFARHSCNVRPAGTEVIKYVTFTYSAIKA
jgi:hypothetical protein